MVHTYRRQSMIAYVAFGSGLHCQSTSSKDLYLLAISLDLLQAPGM